MFLLCRRNDCGRGGYNKCTADRHLLLLRRWSKWLALRAETSSASVIVVVVGVMVGEKVALKAEAAVDDVEAAEVS